MDLIDAPAGYAQHARHLRLDSALPTGSVVVERFHGREAVSESFCYEIDVPLAGQYRELDLDFILQRMAAAGPSIRIEHAQDAGSDPEGSATVGGVRPQGRPGAGRRRPDALPPPGCRRPRRHHTFFSERHRRLTDRVAVSS